VNGTSLLVLIVVAVAVLMVLNHRAVVVAHRQKEADADDYQYPTYPTLEQCGDAASRACSQRD